MRPWLRIALIGLGTGMALAGVVVTGSVFMQADCCEALRDDLHAKRDLEQSCARDPSCDYKAAKQAAEEANERFDAAVGPTDSQAGLLVLGIVASVAGGATCVFNLDKLLDERARRTRSGAL